MANDNASFTELEKRVRTLEYWRYWLLGAAAVVGLVGAVFGRLWLNTAVDDAFKQYDDRAKEVLTRLTDKETDLNQMPGPVAWCYWSPSDGMVAQSNIRNVAREVRIFTASGVERQGWVGVVMFDKPPHHPYVVIATVEGSDAQLRIGGTEESHFWVESDSKLPAFHAVVFGMPTSDSNRETN